MTARSTIARRLDESLTDLQIGTRRLYEANRTAVIDAVTPVIEELTVPRADIVAALHAIRADANDPAVTGPVHHAYRESADRLARVLGIPS